jgi:hypothetical protein
MESTAFIIAHVSVALAVSYDGPVQRGFLLR